jgi:hypothetical protein
LNCWSVEFTGFAIVSPIEDPISSANSGRTAGFVIFRTTIAPLPLWLIPELKENMSAVTSIALDSRDKLGDAPLNAIWGPKYEAAKSGCFLYFVTLSRLTSANVPKLE